MPVLRQNRSSNFVIIPNEMVNDPELSLKDLGLAVWMLSKPQDWAFSQGAIVKMLPKDGESSVKAAIASLKKAGYLEIGNQRNHKGQMNGAIWTISDMKTKPQGCFPPPEIDPNNKTYITKTEIRNAVPTLGGGEQRPEYIIDPETRKWRRNA